jgi:hypothetical protein
MVRKLLPALAIALGTFGLSSVFPAQAANDASPASQSAQMEFADSLGVRVKVFVVYYIHKDTRVRTRFGHHEKREIADRWVADLIRQGHLKVEIVIEEIDR